MAQYAKDLADLGEFTDDDWAKDPNAKEPECSNDNWHAPKEDEDAEDGNTSVASAIESWCGEVNGHKLKGDDAIEWKTWKVNAVNDFWLNARHWKETPNSECKDEREITKDECVEILTRIKDHCDADNGTDSSNTNGGTFDGKCLKYVSFMIPPSLTSPSDLQLLKLTFS